VGKRVGSLQPPKLLSAEKRLRTSAVVRSNCLNRNWRKKGKEKFCYVAIARRQAVRYNIRTVSLEQTIQPTIATTRLKIGNQASCEKLVCGSPSMSLRDSSTGRGQCLANARPAAADT
jgi:hypothetical protein